MLLDELANPLRLLETMHLALGGINSIELPELGNSSTPVALDCNEPTSSSAFHPTEKTKAMGIDPADPTKTVLKASRPLVGFR